MLALLVLLGIFAVHAGESPRPHIVLVMSDDQGWGQTGYNRHPVLRTPNLDAMAAAGLRFERFYAGAPNCSPTRATVLTGRTNDRTGVENHGYPLRLQEQTIARALGEAGYATGHFGKWHLSGLRGPGAPVLAANSHNPGAFGFGEWLSATNYFDRNPVLCTRTGLQEFSGDSSAILVEAALGFIERQVQAGRPTFTVIRFASPHDPWIAGAEDRAVFDGLPQQQRHHYGELAALDRSIGRLRAGLRELGIAGNTLVWFNSDNGGLESFGPETVGGLRGWKDSLYEGGLRVPGIIEWPAAIKPRRTRYPASTLDIFPTLADVAGLPATATPLPLDGISLRPLFDTELDRRDQPIGFRHRNRGAFIDNRYKLLTENIAAGPYRLYDLEQDRGESIDIAATQPEILARLRSGFEAFNASVEASVAGADYPQGRVGPQPGRRYWKHDASYGPYLDELRKRPEYRTLLGATRLEGWWLQLRGRLQRLQEYFRARE